MNGTNIAIGCHPINALSPQTISGGATSLAFSMKAAEHASILISFGVTGGSPKTSPTAIQVFQSASATNSGGTALASFRYYYQTAGGAGNDIFNGVQQSLPNAPSLPPNWTTSSAGITTFPSTVDNLLYAIEIDSAELETAAVDVVGPINELPYLYVVIGNGAFTTYCSIMVVLSGLRWAYNVGASQTV